MTMDCSCQFTELFNTAAEIPISLSCAAWSCMRAMSGEMTMAVRFEMRAGS